MTPWQRNIKNKITKLFSWEYWPMSVVYFPAGIYYIYLSIRAKSFFFFSASNPTIETGGMFFESKSKIFELIPKEFLPKTILITEHTSQSEMLIEYSAAGFTFPVVAKPDRGERGWGVSIINSIDELLEYKKHHPIDFQIQEYIDYPVELSVFYYRSPNDVNGIITSVTSKELLAVLGDGKSSIQQLVEKMPRALLQYDILHKQFGDKWNYILPLNQKKVLVPYGNHVRGALFLDFCHEIVESLINVFDMLSKRIEGFYFGRYDLKCKSIDDLKRGVNFKIVELNGAGAEPAHIYQPGFSFLKAQKVIINHFKMMFDASVKNNKKGVRYLTYKEYKELKKSEKLYKMKVTSL